MLERRVQQFYAVLYVSNFHYKMQSYYKNTKIHLVSSYFSFYSRPCGPIANYSKYFSIQIFLDSSGSILHKEARDRIDGPPPGIMRFAAHLALALWYLGVACIPDDPTPSAAYVPLHDRLQRLVQVYAAHLIDNEEYATVPLYACH